MSATGESLRDPRVDPVAGDVTRYPGGNTYTITRVENGEVHYNSSEGDSDWLSLDEWVDLARRDEIISRGNP